MDWKDVIEAASSAVAMLTVGLVYLLAAWLRTRIKNETLLYALDAASKAAHDAVLAAEQTLRPQVSEALKDGHLDASEAAALKKAALGFARDQLGPKGMAMLTSGIGGAEQVLSAQIEAWLFQLKADGTISRGADDDTEETGISEVASLAPGKGAL